MTAGLAWITAAGFDEGGLDVVGNIESKISSWGY